MKMDIIINNKQCNSNSNNNNNNNSNGNSKKKPLSRETFFKKCRTNYEPPSFLKARYKRTLKRLKLIQIKLKLENSIEKAINDNDSFNDISDENELKELLSHVKVTIQDLQFFNDFKEFDNGKIDSKEEVYLEQLLLNKIDETSILDGWVDLKAKEIDEICKLHPNLMDQELNECDIPSEYIVNYMKNDQEKADWLEWQD